MPGYIAFLVQMGFIIAVWFYGFCCKKRFSAVLSKTGYCILGYAAALGAFFLAAQWLWFGTSFVYEEATGIMKIPVKM